MECTISSRLTSLYHEKGTGNSVGWLFIPRTLAKERSILKIVQSMLTIDYPSQLITRPDGNSACRRHDRLINHLFTTRSQGANVGWIIASWSWPHTSSLLKLIETSPESNLFPRILDFDEIQTPDPPILRTIRGQKEAWRLLVTNSYSPGTFHFQTLLYNVPSMLEL